MDRKLIISPFEILDADRVSATPSEAKLRLAALFFDEIDIPIYKSNNGFAITANSPTLKTLEDLGFATRTPVVPHLDFGKRGWLAAVPDEPFRLRNTILSSVFADRESHEPGVWSLSDPIESINAYAVGAGEGKLPAITASRALELELFQSVVVPHSEVPLDELVALRAEHGRELRELRAALDSLGLEIAGSGDINRAKLVAR